jgi:hypothetical protein
VDEELAKQAFSMRRLNDPFISVQYLRSTVTAATTVLEEAHIKHKQEKETPDYVPLDPLKWWAAHMESSLGCLQRLIVFLLSMPATSASAERFFKNATNTECGRPNLSGRMLAIESRIRDAQKSKAYSLEKVCKAYDLLRTGKK